MSSGNAETVEPESDLNKSSLSPDLARNTTVVNTMCIGIFMYKVKSCAWNSGCTCLFVKRKQCTVLQQSVLFLLFVCFLQCLCQNYFTGHPESSAMSAADQSS